MTLGGDSGEELNLTSVRWVAWHCLAGNFQGWKLSQIGHFKHIRILSFEDSPGKWSHTHKRAMCLHTYAHVHVKHLRWSNILQQSHLDLNLTLCLGAHSQTRADSSLVVCLSVCLSICCRYICSPGELQVLSICFYVLNIIRTFLYLNLADFWDKAWLWNYSKNSLPRSLEGF